MKNNHEERNQIIIRYSLIGIIMNFVLAVSKMVVGHMIDSRAVVLDGLNSFSDMISSLISMLSTLFADKRSDRNHPFGYGRLEYITSMFTSVFLIFMGLHAIYGAIKDLTGAGEAPEYNTAVIVLICVSAAAKIIYGLLSRRTGRKINSAALVIAGTDSFGDAVLSVGILLTIVIYRVTKFDLEPWLSIIMALFLVKTGVEIMLECINKLLGTRVDPAVYKKLKEMLMEMDQVQNVFNLVLHNYGEALAIGSVDIEVDQTMSAAESTRLTRKIIKKAAEMNIKLSSVGVYGSDISDPGNAEMWDQILEIVRRNRDFLRAYAFSFDPAEHAASFVAVCDPSVKDKDRAMDNLNEELKRAFPNLSFDIEFAADV